MAWETISETEIWKPEDVGECRIGEYTDWDPKAGDDGKSNLYSFFDHENDQEWKIWGTTMLTGLMEDVKIGDKIRLEYRGERTSKQGRNYKVFKLQKWVDEDGEEVPSSSLNELAFNPELEAGVIVNGIIEDLQADGLRVTKKLILEVAESQLKGAKPELRKAVARDVTGRKRIPTE